MTTFIVIFVIFYFVLIILKAESIKDLSWYWEMSVYALKTLFFKDKKSTKDMNFKTLYNAKLVKSMDKSIVKCDSRWVGGQLIPIP
jgi:hypothetical protein